MEKDNVIIEDKMFFYQWVNSLFYRSPLIYIVGALYLFVSIYLAGFIAVLIRKELVTYSEWGYKNVHSLSYFSMLGKLGTAEGLGMIMLFILVPLIAYKISQKRFEAVEGYADERGFMISDKGTYGTSRWSTPDDLIKRLWIDYVEETDAVILGQLTEQPPYRIIGDRKHTKEEILAVRNSGYNANSKEVDKDELANPVVTLPNGPRSDDLERYAMLKNPINMLINKINPNAKFHPASISGDVRHFLLNNHMAVLGGSGVGKSRTFARPFLMQLVKRGESVIVTDPKGDLYADSVVFLREHGYTVKVFNLISFDNSDAWNPLSTILNQPENQQRLTQKFVESIMLNTTAPGSKGDAFWENAEKSLLTALILYVVNDNRPREKKTLPEVYKMLPEMTVEELESIFNSLPLGHPALAPWRLFLKSTENMRGGILLGLGTRLQILQNPQVQNILSENDDNINLTALGEGKMAYFMIMSDQDGVFEVLSSLFFQSLFEELVFFADSQPGQRLPVPVNFLLDEFPNVGQIPDFDKKIATVRSRRINIIMIFQTISQLEVRYPNKVWEILVGNCDTEIFLGGAKDPSSAEYLSEKTGQVTIKAESSSESSPVGLSAKPSSKSTSSGEGKRFLMSPDEIQRLDPDNLLLFVRGLYPAQLKKFPFTLHPYLGQMTESSVGEYIPSWRKRQMKEEAEKEKRKKANEAMLANAVSGGEMDISSLLDMDGDLDIDSDSDDIVKDETEKEVKEVKETAFDKFLNDNGATNAKDSKMDIANMINKMQNNNQKDDKDDIIDLGDVELEDVDMDELNLSMDFDIDMDLDIGLDNEDDINDDIENDDIENDDTFEFELLMDTEFFDDDNDDNNKEDNIEDDISDNIEDIEVDMPDIENIEEDIDFDSEIDVDIDIDFDVDGEIDDENDEDDDDNDDDFTMDDLDLEDVLNLSNI